MNPIPQLDSDTQEPAVTMRRILTFFIPLGLTSALMMTSHSIIAAGTSRTYMPEISMAAYAVALTVSSLAESPMVLARQMMIALFHGPKSFKVVRNVAVGTLAFFFLLMIGVGYTSLGQYVFGELLGVSDELLTPAIQVFRFTMLMAVVSCIRSLYHGVLIRRKKTIFVTHAMFARITVMITLIFLFTRFDLVRGGYVGGVTIVAGIATEAFYSMYRGRKLVEPPDGVEDPKDGELTMLQAATFFYPLILAAVLFSMTRPIMTAGMARSLNPAIALAAFQVATSLGWIINAPCQNVHQATMVFIQEKGGFAKVKTFALGFGITGFLLLGTIAFTPVGTWILVNLIAVSDQMIQPVLNALRVMSALPLVLCVQEYYMGILLLNQHTRIVSLCKMANLGAVTLAVLFTSAVFPQMGSMIGAMGQLVGFSAELIVAYGAYRVLNRNGSLAITG